MCLHNAVVFKTTKNISDPAFTKPCRLRRLRSMRLFQALQEGRSSYVTWAGLSHCMELVFMGSCVCVCVLLVRPVALCTWMCILLLGCLSLGHKEMICTYLESLLRCCPEGATSPWVCVRVCACLCVRMLGTRVSHSFPSVSQCSRFFLVGAFHFCDY